MKKKGKLETIIRAFTEEPTIDKKDWETRLEKCLKCPYNSVNIDKKELSALSKIRKRTTSKDFCTICSCNIDEKTSQETEECSLGLIGEAPEWNRIKLEVKGSTSLDITSLSPEIFNVDLDKSKTSYEFKFPDTLKNQKYEFSFLLEAKKKQSLMIKNIVPSCDCTLVDYKKKTDRKYEVSVVLDLSKTTLKEAKFFKKIFIYGRLNNKKNYRYIINLKGKIVNKNGK